MQLLSSLVLALGLVFGIQSFAHDHDKDHKGDVCKKHAGHNHKHGKDCGHKSVKHTDHQDFEHDGHHHHVHADHVDDHDNT